MGLTHRSVGTHAAAFGGTRRTGERIVALAGNPNVGKSTVFNALTGMRQHTGNWAGKTVGCACGRCRSAREQYLLVDLPGTYSLQPHSAEEAVACDFVRSGKADAVVVVCDATCLERTLVLALQMHSVTPNTIVCVNLLDEARRKRIRIDLPALQTQLGMPVVGVTARKKKTLRALLDALDAAMAAPNSLSHKTRIKSCGCSPLHLFTVRISFYRFPYDYDICRGLHRRSHKCKDYTCTRS